MYLHFFDALHFLFIEIKTQHISCVKAKVFEVLADLLFAISIVPGTMPYFQFNDMLFSQIINDNIRSLLISGSGFDIIVSCTVNDRFQKQQKILSSNLFYKLRKFVFINIMKILNNTELFAYYSD